MGYAEDLAAIYEDDIGVTVTRADASTFRGILSQPSDDWLGMVRAARYELRCAASQALAEGDALTIGGVAYTVAAPPRTGVDGLELFAPLWEA